MLRYRILNFGKDVSSSQSSDVTGRGGGGPRRAVASAPVLGSKGNAVAAMPQRIPNCRQRSRGKTWSRCLAYRLRDAVVAIRPGIREARGAERLLRCSGGGHLRVTAAGAKGNPERAQAHSGFSFGRMPTPFRCALQLIRRSRPSHSRSRSTNFWILPVEVLGRLSTISISSGALNGAMRSRT